MVHYSLKDTTEDVLDVHVHSQDRLNRTSWGQHIHAYRNELATCQTNFVTVIVFISPLSMNFQSLNLKIQRKRARAASVCSGSVFRLVCLYSMLARSLVLNFIYLDERMLYLRKNEKS